MVRRWAWRGAGFACVVALAAGLCFGSAAAGEAGGQEAPPNSIQVVVNGALKKTWTAGELMRSRFDWVNPKGKFRPAVALTDALAIKDAGFALDSVTELRVLSKKGGLDFKREALAFIRDLLLVVDVDRGGAWKLAVRTQEAEDSLKALVGVPRIALEGVRRIEVVAAPSSEPKK